RVVIYGAGPIGMMHAMLCHASGAAKVIMVDLQESRLAKALTLGCDLAVNSKNEDVRERVLYETEQQGADVVITACPVPAVQTEAVHLLASYGRLCLFGGLPKQLGPTPIDTNAIHYGNFHLTGTTGGSADDYRTALRLLIGKRVDLKPIISDCCEIRSAADLERAYKIAMDGAEGKVVLKMMDGE
ncbi:MAG: zinc-binding dehydrogenase, partial [Thermoguttaceae bacterium]|nr:zinc-binding dehydrogenase [Thermoguttaceae bacterium]